MRILEESVSDFNHRVEKLCKIFFLAGIPFPVKKLVESGGEKILPQLSLKEVDD